MDWDELRAVPLTIKSCIFVLSSLLCQMCVCVLDCAMDLCSKLESPNKTWQPATAGVRGSPYGEGGGSSNSREIQGPLKCPVESARPRIDFLMENLNRAIRGFTLNHPAVYRKDGALKCSRVFLPSS